MAPTTRRTVCVSRDTDIAVPTFDHTMSEARGRFSDLTAESLETLLSEAVMAVCRATTEKAK